MSITEINAIVETYPVAGIDQSSQTFRDNFENIKLALIDLDTAVVVVVDDLGDVDTTTVPPVSGDLLKFDGADWVPGAADIIKDTTPQLGGNLDVNGFSLGDGTTALLDFVEAGTPVNWLRVTNSNTTVAPSLAAVGGDTNIALKLSSKGTGNIVLDNAGGGSIVLTTVNSALGIRTPSTSSTNGLGITIAAGATTFSNGNGGTLILEGGVHDGTGVPGTVIIRDSSSNRIARFREPTTGTGVNYFEFRSGETAASPTISAIGTDASIAFVVKPFNLGRFIVSTSTYTLRYPSADATDGYVMKTDGVGNLNLEAPSDLGEYTVAGLPDPTLHPNSYALATDASGGRTIVRSDGFDWKVVVVEGATVTT